MKWQELSFPQNLRPEWMGDLLPRIPADVFLSSSSEVASTKPALTVTDGELSWNFNVDAVIMALRDESYTEPMSSLTDWLPFSHMLLPAWLRLLAAKLVFLPQRLKRHQHDPNWPVAPALDLLCHLTGQLPAGVWPDKKWAATITFDVDTADGLRCCPTIADRVERAGYRACFYIVGAVIDQEPGIVKELASRGHEIGSHDLLHDNQICFLPRTEKIERAKRAAASIAPYRGVGFRSPSLFRSPELIEIITRFFAYDSSHSDTDLEYERGSTTVFPYRYQQGVEIPITLPMDSSLRYTGYSSEAMCRLWEKKSSYIRAIGGLAVFVNHAEPHLSGGESLARGYQEYLSWLTRQDDVLVLLPKEIIQLPFVN